MFLPREVKLEVYVPDANESHDLAHGFLRIFVQLIGRHLQKVLVLQVAHHLQRVLLDVDVLDEEARAHVKYVVPGGAPRAATLEPADNEFLRIPQHEDDLRARP